MTIKAIMKIGTEGMTKREKAQEQERRIQVSERINLLHARIAEAKQSDDAKAKSRIRIYNRELNSIKGAERDWLREAAWFMYA